MEVVQTSQSGVPLLRVIGEVDHFTAPALNAAAQSALATESSHLLLDLGECPYLDSGGIGVILTLLKAVRGKGWLGAIGCSHHLLRLLEIAGLTIDPAFRTFSSFEEASAFLADERI